MIDALLGGSSVFGVPTRSPMVSLGVIATPRPSHGFGDDRFSMIGADTGVGRVEAVWAVEFADMGVVMADMGV